MPPSAETPRSARPCEESSTHPPMRRVLSEAGPPQQDAWQCSPAQQEWQCITAPWQQQDGPQGGSWVSVVEATTVTPEPIGIEENSGSLQQQSCTSNPQNTAQCTDDELIALKAEVGDYQQQYADLLAERDNLKRQVGLQIKESKSLHDQLCKAREELSDLLDASRNEMDSSFSEFLGSKS
eukprot:gnl/MRDRNA2_/MRDRNA2_28095_c0_seq1.p2 gnl/MRDRNA2_/MRDRNA2_28095_c0~~gnl/MRDRNA2_/MRDRNA2_28095_c0_seq1.p2  ORF type:complete len:181 (+),score=45.32 gnl/MRDRNA2_/MRDRNA2_28095_c0_seq1:965-1507(+)